MFVKLSCQTLWNITPNTDKQKLPKTIENVTAFHCFWDLIFPTAESLLLVA